ncbi:hypothetical protein [Maridesulfovibrio sp.]|uniref:hypothetical protein n=1 Tax=Maridesulfovibrio sp. TaxID=2795000 RepID=UPI0029CA556C|nr:hypothetical protein [Maridesulfovibrio sp.]
MTQTASISSLNKKQFLRKAFKGFSGSSERKEIEAENPPFPAPEKACRNSRPELDC